MQKLRDPFITLGNKGKTILSGLKEEEDPVLAIISLSPCEDLCKDELTLQFDSEVMDDKSSKNPPPWRVANWEPSRTESDRSRAAVSPVGFCDDEDEVEGYIYGRR
ncbi:hypothetical protein PanWU01x14_060310 [Parasponia andersonii]|uniref:Uncharacterized protein n=1 Tax=Parasponia andersonii TaxID=3476 RepID=A0A2P5DIV0_PARAD|nr:hypothetical protein PanWU01x14_060310 [Parasponia andersonii]